MLLETKNAPDILAQRLFEDSGQHGPLVLMYHSISPGHSRPDWRWSVSEKQFALQLDLLQQYGWKTASVKSLLEPENLSLKTVVITFDDGYADNLIAAAMLTSRGMTATWFVVTDFIGAMAQWRGSERPDKPMLTKSDIFSLASAGMEIGSHSCTHCCLNKVNQNQLRAELQDSKDKLGNLLAKDISIFAYPYGLYDKRILNMVRLTGYSAACTTSSGWAMLDNNPMQIRRLTIYSNDTISSFARKLAFAANDAGLISTLTYIAGYAKRRINTYRNQGV